MLVWLRTERWQESTLHGNFECPGFAHQPASINPHQLIQPGLGLCVEQTLSSSSGNVSTGISVVAQSSHVASTSSTRCWVKEATRAARRAARSDTGIVIISLTAITSAI
jgi:hypothetical protein